MKGKDEKETTAAAEMSHRAGKKQRNRSSSSTLFHLLSIWICTPDILNSTCFTIDFPLFHFEASPISSLGKSINLEAKLTLSFRHLRLLDSRDCFLCAKRFENMRETGFSPGNIYDLSKQKSKARDGLKVPDPDRRPAGERSKPRLQGKL